MAEETTATTAAEAAATDGAPSAPAGDGFQPITSQEQLNAVLKDRLARERGKVRERYADYDELKERAGAADRLRADLDAANARAEEAEASAAALRAEAERAGVVREVAEAEGVDAELLSLVRGETRAELEQAAAVIRARTGRPARYPSVYDGGAGGTAPVSRQDIESIRDPVRRVAARAANAGLYRNH